MEEHPNAAIGTDRLGDLVDRLRALVGGDCVGVPGVETEALLRGERGDLIEMRLDVLHRATTVAMDDQHVQAASDEALRGRQAKAARPAEDQPPLVAREACSGFVRTQLVSPSADACRSGARSYRLPFRGVALEPNLDRQRVSSSLNSAHSSRRCRVNSSVKPAHSSRRRKWGGNHPTQLRPALIGPICRRWGSGARRERGHSPLRHGFRADPSR